MKKIADLLSAPNPLEQIKRELTQKAAPETAFPQNESPQNTLKNTITQITPPAPYEIGDLVPKKGFYGGTWFCLPNFREHSPIFRVFWDIEDLTDSREKLCLLNYDQTMQAIRALQNRHGWGFNGKIYYTEDEFRSAMVTSLSSFPHHYRGEWVLPPLGLFSGTTASNENDPAFPAPFGRLVLTCEAVKKTIVPIAPSVPIVPNEDILWKSWTCSKNSAEYGKEFYRFALLRNGEFSPKVVSTSSYMNSRLCRLEPVQS